MFLSGHLLSNSFTYTLKCTTKRMWRKKSMGCNRPKRVIKNSFQHLHPLLLQPHFPRRNTLPSIKFQLLCNNQKQRPVAATGAVAMTTETPRGWWRRARPRRRLCACPADATSGPRSLSPAFARRPTSSRNSAPGAHHNGGTVRIPHTWKDTRGVPEGVPKGVKRGIYTPHNCRALYLKWTAQ